MKHWRNFDFQLLGLPAGLVSFSVLVLYAISRWPTSGVGASAPIKQALYALMGFGLMILLTNFDYRLLRSFAAPLFIFNVGLLAFVLALGHSALGAQRWINLGFMQLQPSEPAKLLLVIMLAKFLAEREQRIESGWTVVMSLLFVAVPLALVLLQPDLGTSLVLLAIWVGMVLMAGVRMSHLIGIGALCLAIMPVVWSFMSHAKKFHYVQGRFLMFLHPQQDPLGQGYNVIHSLIAVGSGGLLGNWFQIGTQSQLGLVRVEDKDFIFSVISEQVGFLGILILFGVFMVLLMRIARVSFLSGDAYGRLLASGILAMIMFQMFVNIGMNIGLMPVVGIPLPLMSYGGSSLITTLASFGILQSILLRHQKLVFAAG